MKNRLRESKTVTFDATVNMNSYSRRFTGHSHFQNSPDELINTNNWTIAIRWPECLRITNDFTGQPEFAPMCILVPELLVYNGARLVELNRSYYEAQDVSATLDHLTTKYSPLLPADVFFAEDILSSYTAIKRPPMQRLAEMIPAGKDAPLDRSCDVYTRKEASTGLSTHLYLDRRTHLIRRYSRFHHHIESTRIDFQNWDFSKTLGSEVFETQIPDGTPTKMDFGSNYLAMEFNDKSNVRRHRQLLEICEKHGLSQLPTIARKQVKERMKGEGEPLENPGAYYEQILLGLLKEHDVSMPGMGEDDTQG